MRRVVVFNHLTLDGVMQAPGRPDEDPRGGFEHGGWGAAHMDAASQKLTTEGFDRDTDLLLGRWTYEAFAAFWPSQPEPNPFTRRLNEARKYVASRTLKEPLPWINSTLLPGDAAAAVARLKEEPGNDLLVMGSGVLIQSLMRRNLVDEYVLMIHPLVLGSGRRLFSEPGACADLRLVGVKPTPTGVIIATYQPTRSPVASR